MCSRPLTMFRLAVCTPEDKHYILMFIWPRADAVVQRDSQKKTRKKSLTDGQAFCDSANRHLAFWVASAYCKLTTSFQPLVQQNTTAEHHIQYMCMYKQKLGNISYFWKVIIKTHVMQREHSATFPNKIYKHKNDTNGTMSVKSNNEFKPKTEVK